MTRCESGEVEKWSEIEERGGTGYENEASVQVFLISLRYDRCDKV